MFTEGEIFTNWPDMTMSNMDNVALLIKIFWEYDNKMEE